VSALELFRVGVGIVVFLAALHWLIQGFAVSFVRIAYAIEHPLQSKQSASSYVIACIIWTLLMIGLAFLGFKIAGG